MTVTGGLEEMMRQLREVRFNVALVEVLQRNACPSVEVNTLGRAQFVVKDVTNEHVAEGITMACRPNFNDDLRV